jgi:purine-binding chemotaxis protein CheW
VTEPPAPDEPVPPARDTPARKPAKRPARTRRAPARAKPEPGPVQAVVFVLSGDEYALPIDQVREVITYTEPRNISSEVPWVRGVINLRGTTLPVCDLAERLGRAGERAASARIVVVQSTDGPAGLIVDDVREVLTIAPGQLERLSVASDPAITGIAKLGERLVVLVDASAALAGAGIRPRD